MICVYPADCTDFSTNGNGPVSPTSATVTETLNGEYELELEHPIDENGKWQRLVEGCILRAPVPAAMTPAVNYHASGLSSVGKEVWRINTDIPTASVRGGTLRLRSGPGDKYKVLANYKNGSIVQVLNKTNTAWYECTAPDGKHGYFATKYLALERTESSYEAAVNSVVESRQLRDQPFRIYRVVPSLDKITVYARHIFYDLLDNMIASVKPSSSQVGASIVQQISQACMSQHDFTFYSDLDSTAEEVEYVNVNPVDALLGEDGVANKYAGELTRDWFDVYLVKRVGLDTNVQIRQAKNLLGITYDIDITDVVTRIMPTGENASGDVIYLPEVYVDSPYINAYPHPKWIHLPVSEAKESTDGDNPKTLDQCRAEMRAAAQKQFEAGCDQPTVTLNVDYINTGDTEEYKDYAFLQNIYLGDAVRVIVPRIGIWVSMRMTQYTYDCLTKRYTKITLGTVADTVESNVISSRQLPSGIITGSKLAVNSVGAGALQNGSISSAHIQMAAIETAHIQDAAINSAKIGEAAVGCAQIQDAAIIRAKIAEGAIGSAEIDDASITRAKIADAAIGAAQIEDGAINSAHIGSGEIQEAHIHDGAITHAKIGDGEIHRAHIEDGAIDSAKIANAAITNAKIAGAAIGTANIQDGAIVRAKILDGEIVTAKIADLAVTSGKIADLAVSTAKIANAAITNAQIANAAVDTAQIALGAITAALIQNGAVGTAQIADASITEGKIVSLNADVIQSGTLATERLIIRGEDGLIYQINALASGLSMQELSEEQYREQLDGSVLVKRSVTAEQIAAATITANEILSGTITGDKIAAATIEGANLKAGIITTSHLSSEFGKTLDLSSNIGINQTVSKVYSDMETISDAAQAAQTAATSAQASADSKRRVFTSQPVPPYDAGDLWAGGSDTDLMVCAVSRSEGAFSADDWVLASSSVSDLTIGGRNLLIGTNGTNTLITQDYCFSPVDIQEAADAWDRRLTFRVKLNVDNGSWKARIRLIAKGAAATTLGDMVLAIGVLGTFEGLTLDYDSESVTESGWATVTVQMPSTDFRVQAMIIGTGEASYAYPKLELGNSPTQWTPAPEDIQSDITTAQETADNAITTADHAESTANSAQLAATSAQSTATIAKSTADTAKSTADTAKSTADTARTTANNAQATANTAQSAASTAQSTAAAARSAATEAQTTAEAAQSAANAAQESIDTLSIGGNNLIWGTLNPSTDVGKRPAINGLHAESFTSAGELITSPGFVEAITHGIKIVNTEAIRPFMQIGDSNPANGSLYGLKPGETYTLSCDAEYMLLSGTKTSTTYNTYLYLFHDGAHSGSFAQGDQYLLGCLTRPLKGTVIEKRVEWSFTIPDNVTMLYFLTANECSTVSEYGVGDYIMLDNIKLEHGHRATDWTPASEDDAEEIETKLADIHARISNTGESIRQEVQANYALASDMIQISQTVSTLAEQSENNYTWAVTRINQLQSDLNSSRQVTENELAIMRTYMTFGEDGLSIGKTGNPFTFRVINDRLAFYMNDTEVAYLSNNKLYVTQAEILTRMIIGKFAFEPQSNGNLSLIYKG